MQIQRVSFRMLAAIAPLAFSASALAQSGEIAYVDSQGRQWRQLDTTALLTWNQVATVCPSDGAAPCAGVLGGQNVTGFVWATRADVVELFSEWVPAVAKSGAANGSAYTLAGLSFVGYFNALSTSCTSFGCSFWVSGWTSTRVSGNGNLAFTPAVDTGYNPNYGNFSANQMASVNEASPNRGIWLYRPSTAPSCPADLNSDGSVGPADLATLLSAWGTMGPADLNGNGMVDAPDLSLLLAAWGGC